MLLPFLHRLPFSPAWAAPQFFLRSVGLASFAALMIALVAQHGFELHPCEMCLWQRYPYKITALIAVITVLPLPRHALMALLGVAAITLAANAGLAVYHTGIEQHLWEGLTHCSSSENTAGASLDALRAAILSAPPVRCDNPAWAWHGISMAGFNAIFAASLAGFCLGGLKICRKNGA